MEIKVLAENLEQTQIFAKKFADIIKNRNLIINLNGELGAGKTTFAKFLLKELGVKEVVTSPTFTIMNEYQGGFGRIYHFDMYRLNSAEELEELGLYEYLDKATLNGISIIEWPENIGFTKCDLKINIVKLGETSREFTLEAKNDSNFNSI